MNTSSTSLDKAAIYLHIHCQLLEEKSTDERAVRRKIDWRIIPLAFACYAVAVIDKVNISVRSSPVLKVAYLNYFHQYAAVMGMNMDLKLTGNNFSNAASATYIAALIMEIPMGRLLVISISIHPLTFCIRRLHPTKCPAGEISWD